MKILVISDSHGNKDAIINAVKLEKPELVLHLGDHDKDCQILVSDFPGLPYRTVRGNCDWHSEELDTDTFRIGDKLIFMTHGHLYRVKTGISQIISIAVSRGADILLFGHTHETYGNKSIGLTTINPGSIGMGAKTYAVLKIETGAFEYEIKRLPLAKG